MWWFQLICLCILCIHVYTVVSRKRAHGRCTLLCAQTGRWADICNILAFSYHEKAPMFTLSQPTTGYCTFNITTSDRAYQAPPKSIGGVWWVVAWVKCVAGSWKYHTPVSPPLSTGNYVSGSLPWGLLIGRGDIYFQLYPRPLTVEAA